MEPRLPSQLKNLPKKILNNNFYRFLFSFIAVIAGVLLFVLVLGVGGGVQ